MSWDGNIQFTDEDIAKLLQQNPLAAEQLKVIALTRMYGGASEEIKALNAELESLTNGQADDGKVVRTIGMGQEAKKPS